MQGTVCEPASRSRSLSLRTHVHTQNYSTVAARQDRRTESAEFQAVSNKGNPVKLETCRACLQYEAAVGGVL